MIRTIGDSGINWNWYWCIDFNIEEKTCYIFYHERWHKYNADAKHLVAEWLKTGRIEAIETEDRIVTAIKLEGVEYRVTNPQQTFTYRDFTHLVRE